MSIAKGKPQPDGGKPEKAKPDTRNKRTAGQIEQDRTDIVGLFVQGYTQREIAAWIGRNRQYTLCRQQVAADLHVTLEEWKDERLRDRDAWVQKQLLKFAKMETELWAAWERSKAEKVRTQSKSQVDQGKQTPMEATVTRENQVGDVSIIRALCEVQAMIQNLLGLNAPRRLAFEKDEMQTGGEQAPIDIEELPITVLYMPRNGRDIET